MNTTTDEEPPEQYIDLEDIDFSLVTMGWNRMSFFEDDMYLNMQGMNCGISDSIITQYEYSLLREYFEIEKTPVETAMTVSALSQMWIYGVYEVMRLWRDRRFQFAKLFQNGGMELKIDGLSDEDPLNLTIEIRKRQMRRYLDEKDYRDRIDQEWQRLEPAYRLVELYRMNLAKHCAPGKDNIFPRAPGYGRINRLCGALDHELIHAGGDYEVINRRDVADHLRASLRDG